MKVFHLNILDSKEAQDALNGPNGGWSSEPRFTRYADITMGCEEQTAQASLAWLVGEYSYVAHVEGDDLEDAFSKTQHLSAAGWQTHTGVTAMRANGERSTSVGDIVETSDNKLYLVVSVGFEQIDPVAMAKRSTLNELI